MYGEHTFRGKGPIYDYFGNCLGKAEKETSAVSKAKAKNNMVYRIKEDLKLAPNAYIRWDAEIIQLD